MRPTPFASYPTLCLLEPLLRHTAPCLFGTREGHAATQQRLSEEMPQGDALRDDSTPQLHNHGRSR